MSTDERLPGCHKGQPCVQATDVKEAEDKGVELEESFTEEDVFRIETQDQVMKTMRAGTCESKRERPVNELPKLKKI